MVLGYKFDIVIENLIAISSKRRKGEALGGQEVEGFVLVSMVRKMTKEEEEEKGMGERNKN